MTPNIAVIHIHNPHWRGCKLWVPLFLLWIPVILLSPLILLILFVLCIAGGISTWSAIQTFWGILCGLRGTDVRVTADGNNILVRIL
jgi:hypothetical protein